MAAFLSRAVPLTALLVALGGCESPAVRWLDPAPVATSQPSPLAGAAAVPFDSALADTTALAAFLLEQDLLRETGALTLVRTHLDSLPEAKESVESHAMLPSVDVGPAPTSSLGSGAAPADTERCARSLRIAPAPGRGDVAVWWSRRDRGRVMLLAAWRDGAAGAGWRGPIVVDSLDQGPGDAQAADRGSAGPRRAYATCT